MNNVENMDKQGKLFSAIRFVGLDNFRNALQGGSEFVDATIKTLLFTVICLFFQVTLGVFVAILVNRKTMHLKKSLRGILILPWIMPQLVSCLVWKAMFNSEFGFINFMLSKFASMFTSNSTVSINWLQSATLAFVVICIVNIWIGIPFITLSTTSALQSIPEDLYESATIDGAGRFRKMLSITLPSIKPTISILFILSVSGILNSNFDQILVLSNSLNQSTSSVIDLFVYRIGIQSGRFSYATAVGLTKSVVALILLLTANFASKKLNDTSLF